MQEDEEKKQRKNPKGPQADYAAGPVINIDDPREIRRWAQILKVAEEELEELVKEHGPSVEAIKTAIHSVELPTTGVSVEKVVEAVEHVGRIEAEKQELAFVFDAALSPEQMIATITAFANYYRACGGVGLSIEFECQEVVLEEVHA